LCFVTNVTVVVWSGSKFACKRKKIVKQNKWSQHKLLPSRTKTTFFMAVICEHRGGGRDIRGKKLLRDQENVYSLQDK